MESSPTSQDPIEFPEETAPEVKTYLTAKQLREFKAMLLLKRGVLAGDVERLTSEALKGKGQGYSDQSTMPIHMADLGSDNWEQDFTIGLIANEQNLVREIDDALARIEDRTYGMCLATGEQISLARLQAKPWAKYCIEYERAREEGRAP
jgi:RNA polymerase-binding protein DksA